VVPDEAGDKGRTDWVVPTYRPRERRGCGFGVDTDLVDDPDELSPGPRNILTNSHGSVP